MGTEINVEQAITEMKRDIEQIANAHAIANETLEKLARAHAIQQHSMKLLADQLETARRNLEILQTAYLKSHAIKTGRN